MQYHNPFKLFGLKAGQVDSKSVDELYSRLEKDYYGVNTAEPVNYQGTKISFYELKRLIAELKDPQSRAFHEALLQHNELINFLEYGHLGYFRHRAEYQEDEALMEFVAPYFAYQYSEALLQAIKAQDMESISLLSAQKLPLADKFENQYYYDTNIYLQEQIQEMDQLKDDPRLYVMSERELALQVSDKTIELYNNLPDYFMPIRDEMAVSLRKTAEIMAAQGRREGAAVILKQASKLKLNQSLQKEVKSLQKQINPVFGRMPLYLMIGLGLVFLLFLLKWLENTFWPS